MNTLIVGQPPLSIALSSKFFEKLVSLELSRLAQCSEPLSPVLAGLIFGFWWFHYWLASKTKEKGSWLGRGVRVLSFFRFYRLWDCSRTLLELVGNKGRFQKRSGAVPERI